MGTASQTLHLRNMFRVWHAARSVHLSSRIRGTVVSPAHMGWFKLLASGSAISAAAIEGSFPFWSSTVEEEALDRFLASEPTWPILGDFTAQLGGLFCEVLGSEGSLNY